METELVKNLPAYRACNRNWKGHGQITLKVCGHKTKTAVLLNSNRLRSHDEKTVGIIWISLIFLKLYLLKVLPLSEIFHQLCKNFCDEEWCTGLVLLLLIVYKYFFNYFTF